MIYETEVEYPLNASLVAKGYIAYDMKNADPKPVVMVAPDWKGRSELYCDIARKIAHLGYVGFAIDMYGNATLGDEDSDKKILLEPLKENRGELLQRIQSAYDYISKIAYVDASNIAAIGYCFGGMCVLDLARSGADVKGVVSLHGILKAPNINHHKKINSKVLVLHGYEDTLVNSEQLLAFADEMTERKVDWQIDIYGHTHHSFTKPDANNLEKGLVFNASANKRAWDATQYFLNEIFHDMHWEAI